MAAALATPELAMRSRNPLVLAGGAFLVLVLVLVLVSWVSGAVCFEEDFDFSTSSKVDADSGSILDLLVLEVGRLVFELVINAHVGCPAGVEVENPDAVAVSAPSSSSGSSKSFFIVMVVSTGVAWCFVVSP